MSISGFRESGPRVGDAELDALERELGIELPGAYRAFLVRTNGGTPYPEDAFRSCEGPEFGSLMHMFYAVCHEREELTLAVNRMQLAGRVPEDLLAIGCDAGDNQICLGIGDGNRGRIFFWDMEDEAGPGKKPWRRNVREIAASLDEFLASFFDSEEIERGPG